MKQAMIPFEFQHWHAWVSFNGKNILLSDENEKHLRQFPTTDDVINWLYLEGYKDAARALNKHCKPTTKE